MRFRGNGGMGGKSRKEMESKLQIPSSKFQRNSKRQTNSCLRTRPLWIFSQNTVKYLPAIQNFTSLDLLDTNGNFFTQLGRICADEFFVILQHPETFSDYIIDRTVDAAFYEVCNHLLLVRCQRNSHVGIIPNQVIPSKAEQRLIILLHDLSQFSNEFLTGSTQIRIFTGTLIQGTLINIDNPDIFIAHQIKMNTSWFWVRKILRWNSVVEMRFSNFYKFTCCLPDGFVADAANNTESGSCVDTRIAHARTVNRNHIRPHRPVHHNYGDLRKILRRLTTHFRSRSAENLHSHFPHHLSGTLCRRIICLRHGTQR